MTQVCALSSRPERVGPIKCQLVALLRSDDFGTSTYRHGDGNLPAVSVMPEPFVEFPGAIKKLTVRAPVTGAA